MADGDQSIVVVEDDASMRQAVERFLRAAGFHTATFASGEALLQSGAMSAARCLVLDIHLPGLSGIELQRHLARSHHQTPVIFITADDARETRRQADALGAVAYLVKPFEGRDLVDAVHKALAGTDLRPGLERS